MRLSFPYLFFSPSIPISLFPFSPILFPYKGSFIRKLYFKLLYLRNYSADSAEISCTRKAGEAFSLISFPLRQG